MGFGFWSKLDPVGQTHAAAFLDVSEAVNCIRSWDGQRAPRDYTFLSVKTAEENYASVAECAAAGANAWFPDTEEEASFFSPSGVAIH